jgi:hypothetical protein
MAASVRELPFARAIVAEGQSVQGCLRALANELDDQPARATFAAITLTGLAEIDGSYSLMAVLEDDGPRGNLDEDDQDRRA